MNIEEKSALGISLVLEETFDEIMEGVTWEQTE